MQLVPSGKVTHFSAEEVLWNPAFFPGKKSKEKQVLLVVVTALR